VTHDLSQTISWLHFGDLHITTEDQTNYRDFLALIEDANEHVADGIDFAVLPGDNADDGTAEQYHLIRRAIEGLRTPLEIRTGDHDRKSGTLDAYQAVLEPQLWRNRIVGPYRCLFLNSIDGSDEHGFDLGAQQRAWFSAECEAARGQSQTLALFMHAYPSEHGESARELRAAIAQYRVAVVDMGHTHYNELANDGHTIYAATRSTGQIEEGPVGFSVTTIDRGVVSWKFNELGRWPLVKIIAPADRELIIDPGSPLQVVRGESEVRARVWGGTDVVVSWSLDAAESIAMQRIGNSNIWHAPWDASTVPDGPHRIVVTVTLNDVTSIDDAITVLTNKTGAYEARHRAERDLDNVVDAKPERGLLGTRLGPNANGRKW
jgi:Icc protein